METNLQLIIEYWKTEKHTLEEELQFCLQLHDYEGAKHIYRSLSLINSKLHTLTSIDYSNELKLEAKNRGLEKLEEQYKSYDYKEFIKLRVEKDKESCSEKYIKSDFEKRLKKLKQEIEDLQNVPIKPDIDHQEIDDALFELLEKKINGFKLFIFKKENLYFELYLESDAFLVFKIKNVLSKKCKNRFTSFMTKDLYYTGFNKIKHDQNSLEFKYDLSESNKPFEIKQFLAKLIFETFGIRNLDNPMVIEKDIGDGYSPLT